MLLVLYYKTNAGATLIQSIEREECMNPVVFDIGLQLRAAAGCPPCKHSDC